MSLKNEVIKLAKANPDGIRAHLVPILKNAVSEKVWKMIGELHQKPDGTLILRVGLRSGGSAAMIWRKFQRAFTQRKLQMTFEDSGVTFMVPGRGGRDLDDEEEAPF